MIRYLVDSEYNIVEYIVNIVLVIHIELEVKVSMHIERTWT